MRVDLPRQDNYRLALEKAWDRLEGRPPGDFVRLGAAEAPGKGACVRLPVLEAVFEIDLPNRRMAVAGAPGGSREVSTAWGILALHYLQADVPVPAPTGLVSFEEMPEARGYAAPYRGRVIERFCRTVGRSRESFLSAARALGGQEVSGGDCAVRLMVFPRLPVTIVWYKGDDEFAPGASFLYEDVVSSVLVTEDIVVASERLVSRLCGKPW